MLKKIDEMLNIALFPFKDLHFFKKDYLVDVANENKYKNRKNKVQNMVNIVRKNLLNQYSIRNYDEVELMVRKYHCDEIEERTKDINSQCGKEMLVYQHYIDILEKFSRSLLSHRDGKIVYKYWKNDNDGEFLGPYSELEKVHIFYNINKIISMDILTSVYFVANGIIEEDDHMLQLENFYSTIELTDRHLEGVLHKGVSENHIHASASFNFSMSWDAIMNGRIQNGDIRKLELNEFADSDFENNTGAFFKLAYIKRTSMAWFLKEGEGKGILFSKWLREKCSEDSILQEYLDEENKKSQHSGSFLEDVIRRIQSIFGMDWGDREDDFMFHIFSQHASVKTYGENIFMIKAIQYIYKQRGALGDNESGDCGFCSEFFQYIRIKNETYQQLVQGDSVKGLGYFQKYFRRSTALIWSASPSSKEYCKLMLRTLFQNEYLKKVELRTSVGDKYDDFRKSVVNILQAYYEVIKEDYKPHEGGGIQFPKIGLVYHLIKAKDKNPTDKCWKLFNENNEKTYSEISFKSVQIDYEKKVGYITKLRNEVPYLSHFILGLDAASNENNTPVQVFAPVYEGARDSSLDPLNLMDSHGRIVKNKSLAFTFHAGEDFRHVISGLRRVSELMDKCKFRSGDRVGHATALGIDVDYWANKNPVVIMPRGEYLDNLLWIWEIYTDIENVNNKVIIYIEKEIYKISKDIFQNNSGITIPMLHEVYNRRFEEFEINEYYMKDRNKRCKDKKKDGENFNPIFCIKDDNFKDLIWDSEKLLYSYNCKCYLKKIEEPVYLQVKETDVDIMKEIQELLMKKVADKGVVVEVNPTSNAVIGEIQDMFHNHAFEMNKISEGEKRNIMFNINTDDPMVFNTNISNEYAYLYYGLLYRGVCKESAIEWIEKRRKCGMDTSFINDRLSCSEYFNYLENLLKELGCEI